MFWENLFKYLLMTVYLGTLVAVAFYGFHRYALVYLYLKHRNNNGYQPKGTFTELPRITVQLPMYNEDAVSERIIRASCEIDYPLDKLEIQVLDDSTDHSAELARRAVEEMAAKGFPIVYIHRDNRVGYKAGALAAGLQQTKGEFIAIFDADFVPPKDILRNVVNYFTDEKVGMVQVRWDHLNRNASLLTKSQAIFLDGHFVIEHTARNRSGRFMHFNGTAGVWRRTTIEDGGGWQHDTLTEDLDLSYRCQLKGWQFVYLPQFSAPAELPPEMIAFKQQAHRWTKGSMQTAIKLLPGLLRSKNVPKHVKTEAFFHLTNTLVYPLMVLLTLLIWPAFFNFLNIEGPIKHYAWGKYLFSATLFVLATCSASTFFIFGQRELFGPEAGWKTIFHLPVLMALGVGVCINNAKAVLEAIWSSIRPNKKDRSGEFVRTPKYGGTSRNVWQGDAARPLDYAVPATRTADRPAIWTLKRLTLPIIEIAFGIYMSIFIFISLWYQFAYASIPFLAIFAGGYFYVGFSSIYVLWKMQQEAEEQIAAEEALSA
jgi:cellulose synthase/poly-beta-1,6-N-acetylglucosamine synthase-like glycosyltransferase